MMENLKSRTLNGSSTVQDSDTKHNHLACDIYLHITTKPNMAIIILRKGNRLFTQIKNIQYPTNFRHVSIHINFREVVTSV
jgi:hypothetical protein